MALYQISYSALEPVWGDVRLNADTPEDASLLASKEIEQMYPEYLEIYIEKVEGLND